MIRPDPALRAVVIIIFFLIATLVVIVGLVLFTTIAHGITEAVTYAFNIVKDSYY